MGYDTSVYHWIRLNDLILYFTVNVKGTVKLLCMLG